jgi:hypothetical protein
LILRRISTASYKDIGIRGSDRVKR